MSLHYPIGPNPRRQVTNRALIAALAVIAVFCSLVAGLALWSGLEEARRSVEESTATSAKIIRSGLAQGLRGISADIQQMALFTANRLGDINAETPVIFDSVRRAAIDLLGSAPEIRQVLVLGQNNQVLFDSSGQAAIGTALRDEDFLRMGLGRTAPLSLDGTSRLGHPVPDRYLTVGQPATTEQEIPNGRWTIPIMVTSESLNSGLLVSPRNRRDASRATVIAALNPGFLIEQMREASSLKGMEGVIVRVDGVMLAGLPSNKAYDRLRAGREAFGSPSVSVRPDLVALLRGAQTQTLSTALPLSGFQGPMAVSIEENQPFAIMIGFDERAITARWWEDNRTIILVLIGLPLAPIGMILFLSRLAMDKARLQQEIEVLSRAVEQAPVCVIITDRMGRIDYVNPAFTRTFGWPRKEVLGLTPRLLKSDKMPLSTYRQMWTAVLDGRIWEGELLNRTKDGEERWVAAAIGGVLDAQDTVTHFVAVETDITGLKMAEVQSREMVARLDASNRELERFAYVASHDLQEPLRMVTGYLTLVRRRFGAGMDPEAKEFIDYAVEGSDRMRGLIQDLLEYSRSVNSPVEPAPVSLSVVLKEALTDLGPALEDAGAELSIGTLPTVLADGGRVRRVLENLINNAAKYRNPEHPLKIEISASRLGAMWRITIADNGIGIDPQYHDRIFGVFQRLHAPTEGRGNGIGLAVCRRIIEMYGGTIKVESRLGQGSRFSFTLPVVPDRTKAEGPPEPDPVAEDGPATAA